MMNIVWYYMAVINLIGLVVMGIDKERAKKRKYRISEATLWIIAVAGGAIGATFGMFFFRHKTKHMHFKIGFPIMTLVQIWLIVKYL